MMIKHNGRALRKACRGCGKVGTAEDGNGLFWYHDTSSDNKRRPCPEHNNGSTEPFNWTLGDAWGNPHVCSKANGLPPASPDDDSDAPVSASVSVPEPASITPAASAASAPAASSDAAMAAFRTFIDLLAPKVDAGQVESIVNGKLASFGSDLIDSAGKLVSDKLAQLTMPTIVHVETPDGNVRKIDGAAHKVVPNVIKLVSRRKHVMMVGPAATGKSTIATQVAEALGLEFSGISVTADRSTSALVGYMNATGEYVRTAFRDRFEHGGVFLFDEIDNGHPNILGVINAGLANGHMDFPDGRVKRHPDFVCIAAANTYGLGPDRTYVGRLAMDGATRNRFAILPVGYDHALERVICQGSGASDTIVDESLRWVRALRDNAQTHKMQVVMSTRNAEMLCSALDAGISKAEAIEYAVRQGMSDQDWSKLNSGVSSLSI